MRRDLKLVLGPSRPVSFGWCARRPPIELYSRVGTESQVEWAEEAGRRAVAGPVWPAGSDTPLVVTFVPVPAEPQFPLEAMQLLHEVEIRGDVGFSTTH